MVSTRFAVFNEFEVTFKRPADLDTSKWIPIARILSDERSITSPPVVGPADILSSQDVSHNGRLSGQPAGLVVSEWTRPFTHYYYYYYCRVVITFRVAKVESINNNNRIRVRALQPFKYRAPVAVMNIYEKSVSASAELWREKLIWRRENARIFIVFVWFFFSLVSVNNTRTIVIKRILAGDYFRFHFSRNVIIIATRSRF